MKTAASKTRAIRLSENEEKMIQEFLRKNPFFDFSSLARTAIVQFIQNPSLEIRPVKQGGRRKEVQI